MKNGCLFQLFRANHVIMKEMRKENENGATFGRDKSIIFGFLAGINSESPSILRLYSC